MIGKSALQDMRPQSIVFTRYLDRFFSKIFVSHFRYHKPIVSFVEYDDNTNIDNPNNVNIVEKHNNDSNVNNEIDANNV